MFLDVILLGLAAYVAYRIAAEGAWGAAIVFFIVLFSGLFAMNTFEPMAQWLEQKISDDPAWSFRWDLICFLGLFAGAVFALKAITDRLAPASIRIPKFLEFPVRWSAAVLTGYLTMAILLTSLHVAPLPRIVAADEVWEPAGFRAEGNHFFGTAPDRRWLGFNYWISQHSLSRGEPHRVFDGPVYHSGRDSGRWPSLPIRYADRREKITRQRMQSD